MQPNVVDLGFYTINFFRLILIKVWNIEGLHHLITKMWQKLNFVVYQNIKFIYISKLFTLILNIEKRKFEKDYCTVYRWGGVLQISLIRPLTKLIFYFLIFRKDFIIHSFTKFFWNLSRFCILIMDKFLWFCKRFFLLIKSLVDFMHNICTGYPKKNDDWSFKTNLFI